MPATALSTRGALAADREPVAVCGSCWSLTAYVVPGREVVRCHKCPARQTFDPTGDPITDLCEAAARLQARPPRRRLRW